MAELTLIQSILTVFAVAVIYVYLVVSVYPWLTMHPVWRKNRTYSDKGLLRVKFPEGRGVIYRPDLRVCRYVSQYALFTSEGNKYVRLRVDRRVNYIRYDVVTFDRRGRLLDVLEVSERLTSEGSTRAVRLPAATVYACVIPRKVDGEYVGKGIAVGYSPVGIGIFMGLTVLTTVVAGYVLHNELSYILSQMTDRPTVDLGRTLLASVLLGMTCAAGVVLLHYRHAIRRINR